MISDLGYPRSLMAIEKQLSGLPHLAQQNHLPQRRIDILVYTQLQNKLQPLLIIECKWGKLEPKFFTQLLGYNSYIRAPFVGLANEHQFLLGMKDPLKGTMTFQLGLPSYDQLCGSISPSESIKAAGEYFSQ
jgi:hypothetical protein